MSYTRKYSRTISGSVSASFSIDGKTVTRTVQWSEPVHIAIQVDDNVFNRQIGDLKRSVDATTASVVATELAQIESREVASGRIGHSISSGFANLVISEIEQQMLELNALIPAKFMEIQAISERCAQLRQQMEVDFRRISSRYHKLFSDLDNELKLRVQALDKKSFVLQNQNQALIEQAGQGELVGVITVSNQETSNYRSCLISHTIRSKVLRLIQNSRNLLQAGYSLRRNVSCIVRNEIPSAQDHILCPVVALHTDQGPKIEIHSGGSNALASAHEQILLQVQEQEWIQANDNVRNRIKERMERMLPGKCHSERVSQMIWMLWEKQNIAILPGEIV